MVRIRKVQRYPFDFAYIFDTDYALNLDKAHENLPLYATTRYVRWVPLVVPPLRRKEHPEAWQLWVSPTPYGYPHQMLLKDKQIELRGMLPLGAGRDYLYILVREFFRPLAEQAIITEEDYREILAYFRPVVKGLIIYDKGFVFYLQEDWNYNVDVEAPSFWLGMAGYGTPIGDYEYGIKLRTIRLLEKARIAESLRKIVGCRWENLTAEEIKLREDYGRKPLVRNRRLILDTKNMISVRRVENLWRVNFSRLRDVLPRRIDLEAVASELSKVSTFGTGYVDRIERVGV